MSLPKMYCLTLRQTPIREKLAKEAFARADLDVTMFHGVHAGTLGLCTNKTSEGEKNTYIMHAGQVGCLMSHGTT